MRARFGELYNFGQQETGHFDSRWRGLDLTSAELSACSRLFSSTVVQELARRRRSASFARLVAETGLLTGRRSLSIVGDVFDAAFDFLKRTGSRDEYIYRAALTHRVLLGRHNLRTATMLSEFRAGSSKADVVILNGTTTAFEIKSDRDRLDRLERQVADYRRVFANVVVIASQAHVERIKHTLPPDVGIMCLTPRYQISTLREPVDRPERISPLAVMESVRISESKAMLKLIGHPVPDVPNTEIYQALKSTFEKLSPELVHGAMLETLKITRSQLPLAGLLNRLPRSLQAAVLTVPLQRRDHERLLAALATPLSEALLWA